MKPDGSRANVTLALAGTLALLAGCRSSGEGREAGAPSAAVAKPGDGASNAAVFETDAGAHPAPAPPPSPADAAPGPAPRDRPPAAAPGEPAATPELLPALQAHLALVGQGSGLQIVVQVDVRALGGARFLRSALAGAFGPSGPGPAGDASCLDVLADTVEALTYAVEEAPDGIRMGVALADGSGDLPSFAACLARSAPESADGATREAGAGWVDVAPHIALAPIGPRTIAFGSDVLVRRARDGTAEPLVDSPLFANARSLVGPAPAYAVWFDASGADGDGPVLGGVGLRSAPGVGISGALVFGRIASAGRAAARIAEVLDALQRRRREFLDELPGGFPADARRDLEGVLDAVADATFVLRGPTLSFEARLPEDADFGRLVGEALRLVPSL
ncbi:MAG: hypothetical protein HY905_24715 [Deltaproteobacteria bacterium]|nr:hypothetical protein [Deltaproteobacteria bacterium]